MLLRRWLGLALLQALRSRHLRRRRCEVGLLGRERGGHWVVVGEGEKVLSLLQGKANACSNAISSPCGGAHPHVELAQAIMGASGSPL